MKCLCGVYLPVCLYSGLNLAVYVLNNPCILGVEAYLIFITIEYLFYFFASIPSLTTYGIIWGEFKFIFFGTLVEFCAIFLSTCFLFLCESRIILVHGSSYVGVMGLNKLTI